MANKDLHTDDLLPFFGDLIDIMIAPVRENRDEIYVEKMRIATPVEIQLVENTIGLNLHVSAPTQHVETTILPVWHRMTFTIELEEQFDG